MNDAHEEHEEHEDNEYYAMDELDEIKNIIITKNEALFLSDSLTLLMEHTTDQGRIHVPARQLMPSAGVPAPIELIEKVGLAVLVSCDTKNETAQAKLSVSIADLFLLRECCQSFMKINNELVGYNLLRKIYSAMLESDIKERSFIEDLTAGIDMSLYKEERIREQKENNGK